MKKYDIENPASGVRIIFDGMNKTHDGKPRQQRSISLNPGEKKTGVELGDEVVDQLRNDLQIGQKNDPSFKGLIITDHHGDEPGSGQPPVDMQRDYPRKKSGEK